MSAITTQAEKNINFKGGKLKISAQYNKRLSNCFLYVKFNTKQKGLLFVLLNKFIHEKVLFYGCNSINEIYNAFATPNGIIIVCSEKKAYANIANILAYLCKTKITKKEAENTCETTINYNSLHKDIMNFEAYITGKTIHIIRTLSNSGDKKLEKFSEMLGSIQVKDFDIMEVKNSCESCIIEPDNKLNDREKLDFTLLMETTPFIFEGNKLILYDWCAVHKLDYEYMQSCLKTFLISCGSPGSPAANDEGGKKHKAKCKYIMECLNFMCFIVSDSHGFNFKFNDIEDIKNGVSSDSKTTIRQLYKTMKEAFNKMCE